MNIHYNGKSPNHYIYPLVMTNSSPVGSHGPFIEIDDFPSERNLHLWARDFPWRTVSHNQMVIIGHQNQHELDSVPRFHWDRPDFPISQNSTLIDVLFTQFSHCVDGEYLILYIYVHTYVLCIV